MTKDQIIHRDAFTGQIVTVEYAKAHPDTTVRETRKAGKWRRRAEAAEAKLGAMRALHRESHGSLAALYSNPICECGKDYPCPTIRAIDGTEETDR